MFEQEARKADIKNALWMNKTWEKSTIFYFFNSLCSIIKGKERGRSCWAMGWAIREYVL